MTIQEKRNWQERAACGDTDPEIFFPEHGGSQKLIEEETEQAKAYCLGCAVIEICLKKAIENNERFGIWGGMTSDERRALQRRNQRRSR